MRETFLRKSAVRPYPAKARQHRGKSMFKPEDLTKFKQWLFEATGLENMSELALAMGVEELELRLQFKSGEFPLTWLVSLAEREQCSLDLILFGRSSGKPLPAAPLPAFQPDCDTDAPAATEWELNELKNQIQALKATNAALEAHNKLLVDALADRAARPQGSKVWLQEAAADYGET